MKKVIVAGPFNEKMRKALESSFSEEFSLEYITTREEYGRLEDADYAILRTLDFTREDVNRMHKIKFIQRWGAGFDSVDIQAAAERKIPVGVAFGLNAVPVAEMSLALALAVYRNLVPMTTGILAGKWERELYAKTSFTIQGKVVGIVGIGNIGRKVAALYKAFGAEVVYYDAFRLSVEDEAACGVKYADIDKIWDRCDIISLHVPSIPETREMINKKTLAKMKDGAVLINTAREELVNMQDLADALKSGKLLGAGLDAIEECSGCGKLFAGMKNVVLSAHLGGNTEDNIDHMAKRCAEQIMAANGGEILTTPHVVNGHLF